MSQQRAISLLITLSRRLFALTEIGNSNKWRSEELCLGDESVCHGGLTGSLPKGILSFGEDEEGKRRNWYVKCNFN